MSKEFISSALYALHWGEIKRNIFKLEHFFLIAFFLHLMIGTFSLLPICSTWDFERCTRKQNGMCRRYAIRPACLWLLPFSLSVKHFSSRDLFSVKFTVQCKVQLYLFHSSISRDFSHSPCFRNHGFVLFVDN